MELRDTSSQGVYALAEDWKKQHEFEEMLVDNQEKENRANNVGSHSVELGSRTMRRVLHNAITSINPQSRNTRRFEAAKDVANFVSWAGLLTAIFHPQTIIDCEIAGEQVDLDSLS